MRQIKFRAWDKTYKRMNYKVQVGNTDYADANYTCNSIWVDYGDRKSIGWMNADDKCIELMQFTGFKDRDGKEVYEGDILENGELENDSIIGTVVFENGSFGCLTPMFNQLFSFEEESNFEKWSVVGNIYANPEILN